MIASIACIMYMYFLVFTANCIKLTMYGKYLRKYLCKFMYRKFTQCQGYTQYFPFNDEIHSNEIDGYKKLVLNEEKISI